jgi:multiple sugar transport system substrate-binding protein
MALETGPMLVGKGSAHEQEALAYSQWWMGTAAQEKWSTTRGDLSFNPKVAVSDPELDAVVKQVNDPSKNFQIQKRYLEATPVPIYAVAQEVFGKLVTDGGDPMPALQQLQGAADKYWAENK